MLEAAVVVAGHSNRTLVAVVAEDHTFDSHIAYEPAAAAAADGHVGVHARTDEVRAVAQVVGNAGGGAAYVVAAAGAVAVDEVADIGDDDHVREVEEVVRIAYVGGPDDDHTDHKPPALAVAVEAGHPTRQTTRRGDTTIGAGAGRDCDCAMAGAGCDGEWPGAGEVGKHNAVVRGVEVDVRDVGVGHKGGANAGVDVRGVGVVHVVHVLEEAGAGVVSVVVDVVVVVVGNAWEGEEEAVGDVVGVGADAARMYGLGNLSDRIQGQVQVQALAPGSHSHSHLDLVQAQSQNQPQEH